MNATASALASSLPAVAARPAAPARPPRHAREWALALALALAGHALVLATSSAPPGFERQSRASPASPAATSSQSSGSSRQAPAARSPSALIVRRIDAPAPAARAVPAADLAEAPRGPAADRNARAAATPSPASPAAPAAPMSPPTVAAQATAAPATHPPAAVAGAGETPSDPESAEGAAPAAAYAGRAPPVLSTRLAPAFAQGYTMRRGAQAGRAELRLERGAEQYRLSLRGRVEGGRMLEQTSQGGFDAAGVAPERYTDRRRGRAALAANFDRAGARITYSGPGVEQPLFAGGQDRLSWIVQLAGVVQADPGRWAAGARVPLYVSGARGDADLWLFEVQERADLELPGLRVAGALRLTREPQRPFDTRVEVWLDPGRHHLPALLRFTQVPQGGTLELVRDP